MHSISLGPLALPTAPLLLLAAAWLAAWLADRWAPAPPAAGPSAGTRLLHAVAFGLLLARVAYVALHHEAYAAEPLSAVDLRDGGWHPWAGLAGGLAWLSWQAWRRPPWRRALASASAAGLAVWLAGTAALAWQAPRELPDLALTDLATGQPIRLRTLAAGTPIVVNLWATWCGPCRRELPVLVAAQARHPAVVIVLVNQGEHADTVRRYLDTGALRASHVLLDPQARLGAALGSQGLPTTVFFDRDGTRVETHLGALNAAALAARLASFAASSSAGR